VNFFRRLQAPPNPLLQAYTVATGRAVQDAVGDSPADDGWIPVDTDHWQPIFTTLAFLDDNPGVLTANTPGLPAPIEE
jgi:hypothetical protein